MLIRFLSVIAAAALLGAVPAWAQHGSPQPVLPEFLKWAGPPNIPQLKAAWVLGAEKDPATYALRVMLAKGGRIPVHTHPDTRNSTVLSGTLYVGFGDDFDESKMVAVPAGGVYVAPAGVPHYLMARDDDVVYQEAGVGPTATVMLKK
jgi:quercetin dioxygenase-like cupin family protein